MRRVVVPAVVAVALTLAVAATAADAPVRTVTIPGKSYEPPHVDVLVGTTVTWKNDDAINHTVTADGDAFSSGYVPPGGSFTFTFAKQGSYPFHCTIHKFMKGEVDVFGLVLSGPEGPVVAGRRVVFAGLAPVGTEAVTLRSGAAERTVRARPDGSYVVGVTVGAPGAYRASAGSLVSPAVRVLVKPVVRALRTGDTLRASTDPARPGATAVLQSYDRERFAWRGVASARLDARSRVRFRLTDDIERARVLVVGAKGWADAASRPVVIGPGRTSQ
jgi:plastocyanin